MEKPTPKTEVAIAWHREDDRIIAFNASHDAVEDFRDFGPINQLRGQHYLMVDNRYEFKEVLDYITNYDRGG